MKGPAKGYRITAKADQGWWYRATDEQRIAQIKGGVDCGMSAPQIAVCVGANSGRTITDFASRHSIKLANPRGLAAKRQWAAHHLRKAYLSGEPIDAWSAA